MKKLSLKLPLKINKETVRYLVRREIRQVVGGDSTQSGADSMCTNSKVQ